MTNTTYTYSHSVDADVAPEAVWALYEDTATWPLWDASGAVISRDGPFSEGTTGTMAMGDDEPLRYRLVKVEPLREFVDETPVGDIVVRVSHRLEPVSGEGLRLTYRVEIDGPEEETSQIGPAITADFPDTMQNLVNLARERSA